MIKSMKFSPLVLNDSILQSDSMVVLFGDGEL